MKMLLENGDSRTIVCANCGCIIDKENEKFYTLPNGSVICEDCFERDYFECESCGDVVKIVYGYEADGDWYCQDCFFEEYAICAGCGEIILKEDAVPVYGLCGDIIDYACEDCVDDWEEYHIACDYARCVIDGKVYRKSDMRNESYAGECYNGCHVQGEAWINNNAFSELYYCDCCGSYVPSDNWNESLDCCEWCEDDREDRYITSYHDHHGCWEYYGEEKDLFGIELEVENYDNEISRGECSMWLHEHFNTLADNHVAFEKDGSLSEYGGFEIISHPHDWDSFNALDWESALEYMSDNGFKSHDTTTCGLHIHVNRQMFGESSNEQYENLAKVCYFYSIAWEFFLKLSRRTQSQADSWARKYVQDNYSEAKTKVRNDDETKNCSRYSAINLNNRDTIEFRLGRGTLRYESFRAWIDLHLTIVRNSKNINDPNLRNVSMWLDGAEENTLEYIRYRDAFKLVGGEPLIETKKMKER